MCRKKSKTRENGTNKERLEEEKEIHIEENPNAILAIQNLQCRQRRQSDTPSDSSLESADEKLLKLEVCKQFQSGSTKLCTSMHQCAQGAHQAPKYQYITNLKTDLESLGHARQS